MFAFLAATRISRLGGNHPLLNPTLLAIVLISLGLEATHIPYEAYLRGADAIHFMLRPAVVLLAVPLFRQRAVRVLGTHRERCRALVEDSIGLVTALVPALGYETCSRVAKQALAQKRRVADIVLEEKLLTQEQMSRLFRPDAMTAPARSI